MKIVNCTLFCILFCVSSIKGSHILGGSISYEYLGNSQYQILVELYKECGNSPTPFDNPADFTIYDGLNNLHSIQNVYLQSSDTISIDSVPLCNMIIPCVEVGYYSFIVTLPYHVDGYHITYQRCCRSSLISNIQTPSFFGMSITTYISGEAMLNGNSSPSFTNEIPSVFYIPTTGVAYDASATDVDGDSLAYRLVIPYTGASISNPKPIQAVAPPYNAILFSTPYSIDDMIGGVTPLTIDSLTGILTAHPDVIGAFLVAYAVDEYRNDTLLSTTRREFMLPIMNGAFKKNVTGTIFADSALVIDKGVVTLLQENTDTDSLFVRDVQNTDTLAQYLFNVNDGVFYLRAAPDSTSIYFNSHIPTYYGNTLFWHTAPVVDLCISSLDSIDIQLQGITPFAGGSNAIIGTIVFENSLTPVSDLNLVVLNSQGEVAGYTTTNAQGIFYFNGLDVDVYQVYVDLVNSSILNEYPLVFSFSSAGQTLDATVEMQTDRLLFTNLILISTNKVEKTSMVQLFPNPTNNNFNFKTSFSEKAVLIEVISIHGQKMYSTIVDLEEYQLQTIKLDCPTGIYFVKIQGQNQQIVKKLLIQR